MSNKIGRLRQWLDAHHEDISATELESLLAAVWADLIGSDTTKMSAYKLSRIENPRWHSPVLSFEIERHGAVVVGGSSRAELQTWEINLDTGTTCLVEHTGRFRQILPAAPRLDVAPIAREIAAAASAGDTDHRLRWNGDRVVILVGKIEQLAEYSAVKQTLAGRRARFAIALNNEMAAQGFMRDRDARGSRANYTFIRASDRADRAAGGEGK